MISSIGRPAPDGEPNSELERFAERLRGLDQDARLITDRLQRIVTRAFGEGAPDGDAKAVGPMQTGSVAAVAALITSIGVSLVDASEAITRLDSLA